MFVREFYVLQHSASREQLGTSRAADTTSPAHSASPPNPFQLSADSD
jgi:hypothetical protein